MIRNKVKCGTKSNKIELPMKDKQGTIITEKLETDGLNFFEQLLNRPDQASIIDFGK